VTTPYLYSLVDTATDKYYIGCRYAKGCCPSDLGVTYFTSSREVSKLFKDEPSRFLKVIIATGSADYIIEMEKRFIDMLGAVLSDNFYNRANGKAVHPDDLKKGGLKCKDEKLGFHSFTFDEFSAHNKENGFNSFKNKKGVHGRTKSQMSLDGKKSFDLKVGIHARTFEQMSATGKINAANAVINKIGIFSLTKDELKSLGKTYGGMSSIKRYKCGVCGMTSSAGPIGNHFKKTGHSGRTRII
jgi:hypothetical protein